MALHLVVANGLEPLADELAELLATPLPDVFQREVVAVPGDGVRAWLVARLGERLGVTRPGERNGVVANVDFVYPTELVHRAITGEPPRTGAWSVGPLTWAILTLLRSDASLAEQLALRGVSIDAMGARRIADLFDRYALRRPGMVRDWERGCDVDPMGQELSDALRWQPELWRRLCEQLGTWSAATVMAAAADALRDGSLEPDLPPRVALVGFASLPAPHLEVLTALATRRGVYVLVPAPSLALWERIVKEAEKLDDRPIPRDEDPSASLAAHPLTASWGRASREAQLLLAAGARRAGACIKVVDRAGPATKREPLLARLQRQVAGNHPPPGSPRAGEQDLRPRLDPGDRSVQWHRCHGAVRQVEVLRDVIVRLLGEQVNGQPRFAPRDIVILCPDVTAFAPLVEAVFAGDPDHGVPSIPVRVADRSLTADTPLLDAVDALLALLDGRFRASDVLAFTSRPVVRACLGITDEHLALFEDWVNVTNVRWGLDRKSLEAFGVTAEADRNTWRSGLDRLLLGVTVPDDSPDLVLGDTVPCDGVEGDKVEAAGLLAELVHRLGAAHERLTGPHTVTSWCTALAEAARTLFDVPADDAWQWRALDQVLREMLRDAELVTAGDAELPWADLAAVTRAGLRQQHGRPRFGTGAVTLTSPRALRGVPHRVVCWLGFDGELATTSSPADDLTATRPCVGDRDPRSELRAELLDALLAAGERLVICTTGHDLQTNAPVAPAVPIAELLDVIDATVHGVDEAGQDCRASELIAVDHPRHAWSEPNFVPGALVPDEAWSFDTAACDAAKARRSQQVSRSLLTLQLDAEPFAEISVDELVRWLTEPLRSFAKHRLGITLLEDAGPAPDLPALALDSLERWQLAQSLLAKRLDAGGKWNDEALETWRRVQRAAGRVPPLAFSDAELDRAASLVEGVFNAAKHRRIDLTGQLRSEVVEIEVDECRLTGELTGLFGSTLVTVTSSKLGPRHRLDAWIRAAVLKVAHPDVSWRAFAFGRGERSSIAWVSVEPRSVDAARQAIKTALDLAACARRTVIPASAALSFELARGGQPDAEWRPSGNRRGEADQPEVRFLLGEVDLDELLAVPPLPDQHGGDWGNGPSCLERWSHRLWTTVNDTAEICSQEDDDGSSR